MVPGRGETASVDAASRRVRGQRHGTSASANTQSPRPGSFFAVFSNIPRAAADNPDVMDTHRKTVNSASRRFLIVSTHADQAPASIAAPTTNFFDVSRDFGVLNGNLPHWRQDGVTYHVTFRLGDPLPVHVAVRLRTDLRRWLEAHPPPRSRAERLEYWRFYLALEKHLDAGYGQCLLRHRLAQAIVRDAMLFFDGERYYLHDWVIMPNHVHLLMTALPNHQLSGILHSIKSFTAKRINRALGRKGRIWQKESFDHIVRSAESFQCFRSYIKANPAAIEDGGFMLGLEQTPWGDAVRTRRDAASGEPGGMGGVLACFLLGASVRCRAVRCTMGRCGVAFFHC